MISQVQEFQLILHEIEIEDMFLPKTFQVDTITEKLPPAWRDFKNHAHMRAFLLPTPARCVCDPVLFRPGAGGSRVLDAVHPTS